ncbi:MAG: Crp/Fnr family transcriptional regulator [Deltaproteobacteria bacterium]|nr:Crp/Fnr family transcriptional regulator [Deltaproteobacteria bacterium]
MSVVEGKTIAPVGFFADMPEDLRRKLREIATEKTFGKGEMIFYEGDESLGFYLLISGLIKIYKLSPEGKEQILQFIRPNETFGEVVVFSGKAFPANAEAVKGSHVLLFPRKDFLNFIHRNPDVALTMLAILSERLRRFTLQVENLSLKEVPGRLATYFLYLSREEGKGETFTLEISKGQLASLLGTIPETLSRILSRMKDQRIIEVDGNHIRLLDFSRLISLSEGDKLTSDVNS